MTEPMTRNITFAEALNETLREQMRRDPSILVVGEDVGNIGGIFKVTTGLLDEFGSNRVIDTPISEAAIGGAGVGAALVGARPVIEFQFSDFMTISMDQIVNHAAKLRYMTGGQAKVPLVIRAAMCGGIGMGAQHSQNLESWFVHVPGLIVIMPSTPYAAKGLLTAAIRNDNPVVFFEQRQLYGTSGPVPEEDYELPIGVAEVVQEGSDLTIVATGRMVRIALSAARQLAKSQINAEVIDPRTLKPIDMKTIIESVKKTSRIIIVTESWRTCGFASEIAASVAESCIEYLDAPVLRVTAKDAPMPVSRSLERNLLPDEEAILDAAMKIIPVA